MAKKVAPKLIDLGTSIFAVLSPGVGYLKELYGEAHFHDALPRASGCFVSKALAEAALDKARGKVAQELAIEKAKVPAGIETTDPQRYDAFQYFINRIQERVDAAARAVVVELTFLPHGPWQLPPPPKPAKKVHAPKQIKITNAADILGIVPDDDD